MTRFALAGEVRIPGAEARSRRACARLQDATRAREVPSARAQTLRGAAEEAPAREISRSSFGDAGPWSSSGDRGVEGEAARSRSWSTQRARLGSSVGSGQRLPDAEQGVGIRSRGREARAEVRQERRDALEVALGGRASRAAADHRREALAHRRRRRAASGCASTRAASTNCSSFHSTRPAAACWSMARRMVQYSRVGASKVMQRGRRTRALPVGVQAAPPQFVAHCRARRARVFEAGIATSCQRPSG